MAPARAVRPSRPPIAVFTDVDGCILDARTYQPGPARATLRLLHRRGIPVVLCTSKTRAAVRSLYQELDLRLPAIVESGTAVLLPPGSLNGIAPPRGRRTRDGWLVPLAPPVADVRAALAEIDRITRGGVRGFGKMSAHEVASLTGLDLATSRRARQREFEEPFVFLRDPRGFRQAIERVLARRRLQITRGRRFHHLHGLSDKGSAMRVVRTWLRAAFGAEFRTLALGDAAHDLPFLREADLAILVPRPDGSVDPHLLRYLPKARRAPESGPAGWSSAVRRAIPVLRS
jgi:mannosyl-3-phosphoglycerate phosphatase family protein